MSSCETSQVLRRVKVKSVDRTKKGMLASRARADTERVFAVRTPLACTSQEAVEPSDPARRCDDDAGELWSETESRNIAKARLADAEEYKNSGLSKEAFLFGKK